MVHNSGCIYKEILSQILNVSIGISGIYFFVHILNISFCHLETHSSLGTPFCGLMTIIMKL